MLIEHERKIKKNLVQLKQDMDAKDLLDWFIQYEIFDFADQDVIIGYNPNTTSNRNNAFFRLLFQSGPRAYSVFLEALKKSGQPHLAEMIEKTVLEGGNNDAGGELKWIMAKSKTIFLANALGITGHCKKRRFKPVMTCVD